ncbi:hypothetical protein BJY52DRAFT_1185050 [Lactarius psammicola]|nr:hypothetical protein BJY52DRAFT_1185050 [Lactarius psammicola]
MADLVRSAKPGRRWGMNELIAFDIEVIDVNAQTFFGSAILPRPMVSSVILNNLEEPAGSLHKADMVFFAYIEDAMTISPSEESFVDDLVAFEMAFEMCGQRVDAIADVCVMEHSGIGAKHLLLVQEDKGRKSYLCAPPVQGRS